jgi:hypothetical protein
MFAERTRRTDTKKLNKIKKFNFSKMIHNTVFAALMVVCLQVASSISIDASDYKFNGGLNTTATNSYAAAINYGRTHPNRDGGSWSGW